MVTVLVVCVCKERVVESASAFSLETLPAKTLDVAMESIIVIQQGLRETRNYTHTYIHTHYRNRVCFNSSRYPRRPRQPQHS